MACVLPLSNVFQSRNGWEATMGLDPVCGMEVNAMSAEAQSEYEGVTFYFCSAECKAKFDAAPLRYMDGVDLAEMRARQNRAA